MIIVTNSESAVMYYSESQWLDAFDASFPAHYSAFRVPNSTKDQPILGAPGQYDSSTGTYTTTATDPMTRASVASIATEILFEPSP